MKGFTSLHIAATYGNYEAIELLLEYKSNIFALDNRGMHAAKIAALNKRLECYRLLDSLYFQFRVTNPEYVKAQQTKAINTLEKRLQKAEKLEKGGAANVAGGSSKIHRFRLSSLKKSNSSPQKPEEDEMFVLKDPNKKDSEKEDNEENDGEESNDEGGDIFDPIFVNKSAKSTLRPLPKMTSGAMLQTLTGMAAKNRNSFDDNASGSSDPSSNGHGKQSRKRNSGNLIGTIELVNPTEYEIENDSPLVTFLHSVDAYETGGILLQEKMDLKSLMLCTEEDLKSIGLALGPRKKIMTGINDRASVLSTQGSMMSDTDL